MIAMMRRVRRHRSGEAGFTLIELLLCSVIIGVIVLPLGNFVLAYFQNLPKTLNRVSNSHDMQIAAAYFSQDAANIGTRSYVSPANPATGTAQQSIWVNPTFPGTYCGQGLGTTLVLFEWDTISATLSGSVTATQRETDAVSYVVISGTLHRIFCAGSPVSGIAAATPGATVKSNATLVHNLFYPDSGNTTPVTCSSSCTSTTWPASVSLKLSLRATGETTTTYATLTGDRRQT